MYSVRKLLEGFKRDFFYPLIYKIFQKKFKHALWPTRLSSRAFNFTKFNKRYKQGELLNIGAGPYFNSENFISLDFTDGYSDSNVDQHGRMFLDLNKNLDHLPLNNLKVVYTSHCLEHFRKDDTKRLLTTLYRSMDNGGIIRIVVPDADLIINKLKQGKLEYFTPFFSYFGEKDSNNIDVLDMFYLLLLTPKCRITQKRKVIREYSKEEYLILEKSNKEIINICNDNNFINNEIGAFHLSCYSKDCMIDLLNQIGFNNVHSSAFMQSDCSILRDVPTFDGSHPWMSMYIEATK